MASEFASLSPEQGDLVRLAFLLTGRHLPAEPMTWKIPGGVLCAIETADVVPHNEPTLLTI